MQISQVEFLCFPSEYASYCSGDLARDESFTAPRAFVVKKNAIRGKKVIGCSIGCCHPISIEFGRSVGTSGPERGALTLRRGRIAKHLRGTSLIKASLQTVSTDSL